MIILKPAEMREMDQRTIEAGFPDLLLMETAGRGLAELACKILREKERKFGYEFEKRPLVLIFVGKGNNGGDGLVAARFLHMWGYRVEIILMAGGREFTGSARINYQACKLREISIKKISNLTGEEIRRVLIRTDLVIDAMLGTGLKGEVRGRFGEIIDLINGQEVAVLAVDIPSGIDGERGRVYGRAIRADYTATMAFPKLGLILYPGRKYTGELEIIDLGMVKKVIDKVDYKHFMLTDLEASQLLPVRIITGHKGTFGKIGVIGGSNGMAGAPALTGIAALKTGAGLVKVAIPGKIQSSVAQFAPELITLGLVDDEEGKIEEEAFDSVNELKEEVDLLAVGPGLGRSPAISQLIDRILIESEIPLLLDADGINGLTDIELLQKRKMPLILTPHAGEMAGLLKVEIKEIEADRIKVAREFAQIYGVYLVLKGAATVIALPDGRVFINPTGNEGMATAGSGDVLTGIISGLLAQGMQIEEAVILGPYLHGRAGDLARNELSSCSVLAGDIVRYISEAIKSLKLIKEE